MKRTSWNVVVWYGQSSHSWCKVKCGCYGNSRVVILGKGDILKTNFLSLMLIPWIKQIQITFTSIKCSNRLHLMKLHQLSSSLSISLSSSAISATGTPSNLLIRLLADICIYICGWLVHYKSVSISLFCFQTFNEPCDRGQDSEADGGGDRGHALTPPQDQVVWPSAHRHHSMYREWTKLNGTELLPQPQTHTDTVQLLHS